jgi:hypothetical protein
VSTISTPDWSYTLTPEDKFWAAKMVEKEGGDAAADLWTMASRFAFINKERYPTFTALIRAYSVPIQADEARYRAWQSQPADPGFAELVDLWAQGEVLNPVPRAAHFATGVQTQNCLAREGNDRCVTVVGRFPADRPPERQNWHSTTPVTETWPDNYVRVGGAGDGPVVALPGMVSSAGSSGGSGGLGILLAGAAILSAAFYFGRRR